MRTVFQFLFLGILSMNGFSQVDSISQRVFLIGDAGELIGNKQPVIDWIRDNVNLDDERNTFLFLGDNVYPTGLPMEGEAGYDEYKKILDYQINLVKGKKSKSFFVMGNHDWKGGKLGGWQQVINQINYINGLGEDNIQAWPRDGCPGPIPVELNDKVVAVFIDSQWFLYVHEKAGPSSTCPAKTVEEFATELEEIAAMHPNQLMVIAMHHPMYTYGPHGSMYTWKEHLFPFTAANPNLWIPMPVIGSIYPITRGVFGNLQDVRHPLYKNMVNIIESAMKRHPNAVHVAGHEHSLQMIIKDDLPFIVSGSAINLSRVKKNREGVLLFSDVSRQGFAMLEVRNSGKVEAKFYNLSSADLNKPLFVHQLDSVAVVPEVVSKDSIPVLPDSILVAANPSLAGGGLKRFFMGDNYREEWTTPIKVEVLDLGKEQGGLTPEKQGGGKQTRSLRLEDKNGKEWVLRSVRKFPEAAIPADLRSQFTIDVVEDGISASYPFAALSVGPLANAAGIPSLRRKLVYIPDDPRLGRFRNTFKNSLAMLEEREPLTVDKTYNTDELILRLAKDNDDHVDQRLVLKARLLDNFYMDLDRHEDQWRWATRDTGRGKIYYPIPRDQDQAFFINQGVIPYFVKKPWMVPELQGFAENADNIKTFNRAARNLDRFFLNELNAEQWSVQIDSFLSKMTDSVLTRAMSQQPREVRHFHGDKILRTLQGRRNEFKKDMMEYYEFISRRVNIVGTNQRELFTLERIADGNVHVTLNKIDKDGNVSSKIYDRVFDPGVTKELFLYGLADADSFVVRGGRIPMRVRIIGGPGKDHFLNEGGDGKLIVYDVSFEENKFSGDHSAFRKKISNDPKNNQYNRLFYKYNIFHPGVSIAYNVDDGIFLGAKAEYTRHGFRKEPFSMRHTLSAGHAMRTSSWYFRYIGEVTNFIKRNDLVVNADVRSPVNVTNFFGLGNETNYNKDLGIQYYRARYDISNLSFLVRRQMQSWMRLFVGPSFQTFRLNEEKNMGRYVSDTTINGLKDPDHFRRKTYAGAEFKLDINSRNNQVLPTRGFLLDAGVRQLFGINKESGTLTQLRWDMSVVASFVPQAKFIFATRLGWYHNIGDFEFPQANYLGGPTNLRGYRRDRFGGRTMLFNNSEVRMKLGNFTTYLFPGSIGLLAFHDIGRVWMDGQSSDTWHNSVGAGVWIAPIQRFVITASFARSGEENVLPYVTFGFQF